MPEVRFPYATHVPMCIPVKIINDVLKLGQIAEAECRRLKQWQNYKFR